MNLMLVNIFIAILASTMGRVTGQAKAYFLLQRATLIITKELGLCDKRRLEHINLLKVRHTEKYDDSLIVSNEDEEQASELKELSKNLFELNEKIFKMDFTMV